MDKATVGTSVYVYSLDSMEMLLSEKQQSQGEKPQKSTWLSGYTADK